jgi:hypothetical protein
MNPMLKVPGIQRLKLYYAEPPSTFAFKFNLRHHHEGDVGEDEEAEEAEEAWGVTREIASW